MSLDKGRLPPQTDHRHYFRDIVFQNLPWLSVRFKTTEEARAIFQLVIKGIWYGEFVLRIAHTIGVESKAYKQNNAMTRLSWGPIKTYIENPELKGRTLCLYRDMMTHVHFLIDIDS